MSYIGIFKLTLPVLAGYIPIGIAFGLLASSLLIPWYYVFFMSLFVYAGAAQFLMLGLFALNASLLEAGVAIFLLNFRHFFYSLSMLSSFNELGGIKKYLIFGLTDETFALLKTIHVEKKDRDRVYGIVTFLNHFYWIIGSVIGVTLGHIIAFDTTGIEFCLVALFVVMSIELYKKSPNKKVLLLSLFIGLFSILFLPSQNMLVLALGILLFCLIVFKDFIDG